MKTCFIMRGIPGAGKSTFTKRLAASAPLGHPAVVCSADDFFTKKGKYEYVPAFIGRAHAECYAKFEKAIDADSPVVIVDNTHISHDAWRPYAAYAKAKGYAVATVVVEEFDVDKCIKRNVHKVPPEILHRMAERFQR